MTRPEPRYRLLRLTESDLLTFIKCRGHRPADYYAIPFLEPDDLPEDAYIAGIWDYRWERNSFLLKGVVVAV